MHDSKLIELCKALTSKELVRFSQYIESELYNTSEKIVQLFDFLKRYHPHYQSPQLSRNLIAQQLFSDYKNADVQLRTHMTQLTKLLKDFFIMVELEVEERRTEALLIALQRRQLHSMFKKEAETLLQQYKEARYKNDEYYRSLFNISSIVFSHQSEHHNRAPYTGFQEMMNYLDLSFIMTKLKYIVATKNRQNVLEENIDSKFLEDILPYIEQSPYYQLPFVQLYYYLYKLITNKDDQDNQYYKKLKVLLQEDNIAPIAELRDIYIVITNYCIRALKKGNNEYLVELFDLYEQMLNKDIRPPDGFLSPYNYSNIIVNALKLKKFDWVKQFIHEYRHQVLPERRENAFNYGLALYYFYLKDYDKTLEYISEMDIVDTFDTLRTKVLYIKTFYEKGESISLHATLESLRIYLSREQTISEYNNQTYKNFKNFTTKLYRIKEGGSKNPKDVISEIKQCNALIEAQWLLTKAEELMTAN
jgi:hypothetical protein